MLKNTPLQVTFGMFDNKIENVIVLFILKHSSGVFLQKEIIS